MKKIIKSFVEILKKFFPKENFGLSKYNLNKYQIYPEGKYLIKNLNHYSKKLFENINFDVDNATCIGTCFAERLAEYLNKYSSSYKIKEPNNFYFEANWGRVYTPKNLVQLLQYSIDERFPTHSAQSINGFIDPIRDYACGTKLSEEDLLLDITNHRKISKKILVSKKFIFITLGQTEVWFDEKNNFFWGNTPSKMKDFNNNNLHYSLKTYDFTQTKNDILSAVYLLQKINADIKIIFTLSPVPAYATFLENKNVILTSSASKALLRASIEEIVNEQINCFYFPSYEYVMCDNKNFIVDNRHVREFKVDEIFKNFIG